MTHQAILDKILSLPGKTAIYWDIDGTLARFDRQKGALPDNFYINKPPIKAILNAAIILDEQPGVTSFVLSKLPPPPPIGSYSFEESERQKNAWLDKYAPFIEKHNRIFCRDNTKSAEGDLLCKYLFFKDLLAANTEYDNIVFVDDDVRHIRACRELEKQYKNFLMLHSIEFVD